MIPPCQPFHIKITVLAIGDCKFWKARTHIPQDSYQQELSSSCSPLGRRKGTSDFLAPHHTLSLLGLLQLLKDPPDPEGRDHHSVIFQGPTAAGHEEPGVWPWPTALPVCYHPKEPLCVAGHGGQLQSRSAPPSAGSVLLHPTDLPFGSKPCPIERQKMFILIPSLL